MSYKATSPFALLCLLLMVSAIVKADISCQSSVRSSITGTCQTYPADGLCGSTYAGKSVWIPLNSTLALNEQAATETLKLILKNSDQVTPQCLTATSRWTCANYFQPCLTIGTEDVPVLGCLSDCESYWNECRAGLELYLNVAILQLQTVTVEQSNLVHCSATATWLSLPQPVDIFGVREINQQPIWAEGYRGQPRFPATAGVYKLLNGTNVTVPCMTSSALASQPVFEADTCAFPLENVNDGTEQKCAMPCPFPVIPLEDLKVIAWAFIVPGIIGVIFSVFVCLDTLWLIFDTSQGFGCYNKVRRAWALDTQTSRHDGSSADQVMSQQLMSGVDSASSGNGRRRVKVRSSDIYALLGSILGIIYFCIGPLLSLIRFENISCGSEPYYDVSDLLNGDVPFGDGLCKAQRVAPFILQAIFNLMLYALFRVLIMVDQRFRKWSTMQVRAVRWTVLAYCALGPCVTLGISLGLDKTTSDITLLFGEMARNSAICFVRLSPAQEIILVIMPFVLTGTMITLLSIYIFLRLSNIQAGVKDMRADKTSSSDKALRSLMNRLSVLGLATFFVVLILIATTGYLIGAMEKFSPLFNNWFGCETVSAGCASNTPCPVLKEMAYAESPSFNVFAVQIAAMSCISLLLSGFFAAQALPRFYSELRSGALAQKLDNILEGRPLHYNVGSKNNSSANAEAVKTAPEFKAGRVNPGTVVSEDNSMAAYMVHSEHENVSPVFEHEMAKTSKGSRVAASSGD